MLLDLRRGRRSRVASEARMLVSGLTGPGTLNLYKVPFTLTEEFVSVYRMHPLLADNIEIINHKASGDRVEAVVPIDSARDGDVEKLFATDYPQVKSVDWMYSFGRNKAGLMTLHNYPKFMENMEVRRNIAGQKRDQPIRMNMGAVDIVRDRERQTPRYNAFRQALGLRPIHRFEELFITSRVLYEKLEGKSSAYQEVIEKLRKQVKADPQGYDVPMIERKLENISAFSAGAAAAQTISGGKQGLVTDGKRLVPEGIFYDYYFALPLLEQQALLTPQEIEDIANMKRLYNNDVNKLDLLVGTLAEEDRFDSFGFGNTPFYIFALMASRRLMTDPFLSDLYTKDVYTFVGKQWVEQETMIKVITRHFPELQPKFVGVKNAFHPWNPN